VAIQYFYGVNGKETRNTYQFFLNRAAENPIRNKDSYREWRIIRHSKFYFKKPIMTQTLQGDEGYAYCSTPAKVHIIRMPAFRRVRLPLQPANKDSEAITWNTEVVNAFDCPENYEFWIYLRWHLSPAAKDISTLPNQRSFPILTWQSKTVYWDDN
jgi:hypothetical protein